MYFFKRHFSKIFKILILTQTLKQKRTLQLWSSPSVWRIGLIAVDNFLLEEMVVARLIVPMGVGHVIAGVKHVSSTRSQTVKC